MVGIDLGMNGWTKTEDVDIVKQTKQTLQTRTIDQSESLIVQAVEPCRSREVSYQGTGPWP
jgi:hypothetical protein